MLLLLAIAVVPGALNPVVTQATIGQTICVKGWTATVCPPELYTEALKYKLIRHRHGRVGDYELDHAVPIELGGAVADPRNLWLEPHAGKYGSHAKDRLENRLRYLVCKGQMQLDQARRKIWPHWIRAYHRQFG